jgi:hypothetical protein
VEVLNAHVTESMSIYGGMDTMIVGERPAGAIIKFTLPHRKAFGFNREIQGQVPRFLQKSALQK